MHIMPITFFLTVSVLTDEWVMPITISQCKKFVINSSFSACEQFVFHIFL